MITTEEAILKGSQSQLYRIVLPVLPPLKGRALERKVGQMRAHLERQIVQMRRRAAQD